MSDRPKIDKKALLNHPVIQDTIKKLTAEIVKQRKLKKEQEEQQSDDNKKVSPSK